MAEELDGKQVHFVRELFVRILASVELRRSRKRVDQDQSRFRRVIRMGHLVAGLDAAQVGHYNLFVSKRLICKIWSNLAGGDGFTKRQTLSWAEISSITCRLGNQVWDVDWKGLP